jgi:hypothetical protein
MKVGYQARKVLADNQAYLRQVYYIDCLTDSLEPVE